MCASIVRRKVTGMAASTVLAIAVRRRGRGAQRRTAIEFRQMEQSCEFEFEDLGALVLLNKSWSFLWAAILYFG